MEVYSISSRTAIFNVYLCDDGTVFNEFGVRNVWRHGEFKVFQGCVMKFNDFQAPVLFSSTFEAWI